MALVPKAVHNVVNAAHSVRVLARAGLVQPTRLGPSLAAMRDVRAWGPLVTAVRRILRTTPDAVALVDERGRLTYRELDIRSTALASAFHSQGVGPDHVVALLCRDHRGLVESMLACGKLGAKVLLLNTGFAAPQLLDVLHREHVSAVVHDEEFTPLFHQAPIHVPRWLSWYDSAGTPEIPLLDELIAHAEPVRLPTPERAGAVVLLTSGTTGTPKGAQREIRSVLTAADFLDRIPLRSGEGTLIAAPVFHAVGYAHLVLALSLGSKVVLHRRFDPRRVLRSLADEQCTALVLVPTMLQRIVDLHPDLLAGLDLAALRVVFCSGANLPPQLATAAMDLLGDVLYNLYGSTEVAVATVATPADLRAAPGTAGRPPRGCVVRLFDDQDRPVQRPHVTGRIFVSGSLTFTGYTGGGGKGSIDGLVSTGDLGHLDEDGRLFVDGREDDMIVSGGENVYPLEVENLLMTHYRVRDAAVVGVPDPEFGQRLKAFVVPIPGTTLDGDELREFVRSHLARHKVPREVVVLRKLPRNATGKVIRRQLMAMV